MPQRKLEGHRERVRERLWKERLTAVVPLAPFAPRQPSKVADLEATLVELERKEVQADLMAGEDRPWQL